MAETQNLKETTNDAQEQQAVEKNQLPLNLRYDEEVGELIKRNDGSSCYRERCEDNGPQDDERSEG